MALPLELFDCICTYLPISTLKNVALSGSHLHPTAQRLIYADVTVTLNTIAVVMTLSSQPHLSLHVRNFKVVLETPCWAALSKTVYRALAQSLSGMTRLISLSIHIPKEQSSVLPGETSSTFPELRILRASFDLDDHVATFLTKAPGLVALELDEVCDNIGPTSDLPSHVIPDLSSFSGTSRVARSLVPGRPVSSILITSDDLTTDMITALSLGSSLPITTFSGTTSSPPTSILAALATEMPELEYVRLGICSDQWGRDLYDEVRNPPLT